MSGPSYDKSIARGPTRRPDRIDSVPGARTIEERYDRQLAREARMRRGACVRCEKARAVGPSFDACASCHAIRRSQAESAGQRAVAVAVEQRESRARRRATRGR